MYNKAITNIGIICEEDALTNKIEHIINKIITDKDKQLCLYPNCAQFCNEPEGNSKNECALLIVDCKDNLNIVKEIQQIKSITSDTSLILLISNVEQEVNAIESTKFGIDNYIMKSSPNFDYHMEILISKAIDYYYSSKKSARIERIIKDYSKRIEKFRIFNRNLIQFVPMGVIVSVSTQRLVNINETAKNLLELDIDVNDIIYDNLLDEANYDKNTLIERLSNKDKSFIDLIRFAFNFDSAKKSNIEHTLIRKHNTNVLLDVSSKILKDKIYNKDRLDVYVKITIFNDITKFKKMEEQFPELKKIASLGRLSAGIAHEIRNPLTSMNMFCSYILDSFDQSDERKLIMQKIVSEIKRLDNLVKNISSYSKDTPMNYTMINLRQTIENTLFFVNQYIKKKNIIVENEVENDFMIFADAERIKQVFINIFINSINAMEEKGTIRIMATKDKKITAISISDTGCGISNKIVGKIFEPFFTTDSQSSGLGLSIVQKIISQHNGEVKISNRKDGIRGTLVKIILPRMSEKEESEAQSK